MNKLVFITFTFLTAWANANEVPALFQQCVVCHGEQAQGNKQLKAPALAGQSESYLKRQLIHFSNGLRGAHKEDVLGMQMVAISKQLNNNKEVSLLTKYLSNLSASVVEKDKEKGNLKNGSRYYQAKCGACHGGQAQGNEAMNAPKLSGLGKEYMQRQMLNFSTGIRGTHADDKFGRQMAMMAKTSSGQELEDILHYIAVQK
ncbi:MAG: c-type cytochrome [Cognaticolwellia aestuarii]